MVIATNNEGKIKEIKEIFKDYELFSLKDKGLDIDVIEDQDTFLGNATKKAKEVYAIVKEPVIADDSGLCINALNDFPGVLTHRFLGEDATEVERNNYLIEKLEEYQDRSAKFICYLVYYDGKNTIVGEGILNGFIARERRGTNNFGFDEIFELSNGKTLAELSLEEKNKISARSLAIKDLREKLKNLDCV